MKLRLYFPEKPFLHNKSWRSSFKTNRVYLAPEAKKFKQVIEFLTRNHLKKNGVKIPDDFGFVHADYIFHSPRIITGKGNVSKKKGDVDGGVKLLQDACCSAMGIDDSSIVTSRQVQVPSNQWGVHAVFTFYSMDAIHDHTANLVQKILN